MNTVKIEMPDYVLFMHAWVQLVIVVALVCYIYRSISLSNQVSDYAAQVASLQQELNQARHEGSVEFIADLESTEQEIPAI